MKVKSVFGVLIATGTLLLTGGASAQDAAFPSRLVHVVTWATAGASSFDAFTRFVADKLSQEWRQPVVVESKPGAVGIIATEYVARAKPDGYTILITSNTPHIIVSLTKAKLPYDPIKDFEPVSQLAVGQYSLVVPKSAPYNNAREFVAYARGQSKELTYGSPGIGSGGHLLGAQLANQGQTKFLHVPYKGSDMAAVTDMLGGRIDSAFVTEGIAKAQSQAGKIKVLGVTGAQRNKALPEVPTLGEQGFQGFEVGGWIGAYVPAGTPKPIINKIAQSLREVLALRDVQARTDGMGLSVVGGTPEEFVAIYRSDFKKWSDMVRAAGIAPE